MSPKKISVLIPVFREAPLLKPMLDRIQSDPYESKEIIVCVDEPTEATRRLTEEYPEVTWRLSQERQGKVWALNPAAAESTGDILVFLDSDIEVRMEDFLSEVAKELESHHIIEIKKLIIRDSFLSRIVSYDYLSSNFTNYLFSRYLHRCIALNGAAFAIRRETWNQLGGFSSAVCEDLDLATRAWNSEIEFGYPERAEVWNSVDPSWATWLNQRNRWGIGQGMWLKENWAMLLRSIAKKPQVLIPALLIIFPSVPVIMQVIAMPEPVLPRWATLLLVFLSSRQLLFTPPALALGIGIVATTALIATAVIFLAYACIFYLFARKLGYSFNILEFAFFFFIYNPLWLLISIASLIRVVVWKNGFKLDWKI